MYRQEDLIRVAKRENNPKRKFVLVNPLQGKHMPVVPGEAMELFGSLAQPLKEAYAGERLLLIGFAETATAIGAAVAARLGAMYIQTTREKIPGVEFFRFSEDHSHATEQKLAKNDLDRAIGQTDRIVFIEDEVTTGRTILHIIEILKRAYPDFAAYAVASILNGMDEECRGAYEARGIDLHYLAKADSQAAYTRAAELFSGDGRYVPADVKKPTADFTEIRIGGLMDARRLVNGRAYAAACEKLYTEILRQTGGISAKNLLIIGTEEFMYPALYAAARAQEAGIEVRCHSATRSPIAVSCSDDYPLHVRYELRSLYDGERVTYLYDIGAYEAVWIVTDAQSGDERGVSSLVNAVRQTCKGELALVRWCGA